MAPSTSSIEITYDDGKSHSVVEVAGEFSNWNKLVLTLNPANKDDDSASTTVFSRTIDSLVPGNSYMYKFVVDGEWLLSSDGRPLSK